MALTLAFAIPAGTLAAAEAPPPKTESGPTVSVIPAATMAFTETILVTGSLVAREEVLVAPQIEGGYRIREVLAEQGDTVVEGQVLARLNDDTLKAQLDQQEANLLKGQASIEQAQSRIEDAEATKKRNDASFARAEELLKSGSTSRSVFDEREAAAQSATAAVTLAKDGLRVSQAEKTQIEAQIHELKLRLAYAEIKAPAAGIISRRTAKVGALATSQADPLFRIITKGEIELDAEVPEVYLPRLSIGQSAKVDVAGLKPREGKLRLISPEVDPATRLGRVRIFIGADKELRIGTFARGTVGTETRDALGIPANSVLTRSDGAVVKVVKDGVIETRKVTVGLRSEGKVEILDGLQKDDLVVLRSGMLLRDGDRVRPVKSEEKLSEAN